MSREHANPVATDLAVPVASIAWTVTHEEVFREPRDCCQERSESAGGLWQRKFFYLFTCEYCCHYVAAAIPFLTRFRLLYPDWRGYMISFFGLAWVSNLYMAGFANLRLDIDHERVEIKSKDQDIQPRSEQLKVDGVA